MNWLQDEFDAAVDGVRTVHLDRIRALGVAQTTIARLGMTHAAFGILTATTSASGFFEPGPGPLFVVQPVVAWGAIVDLVAWRSAQPERWYLRTGHGWLLGEDQCLSNRWDGDELTLAATPLDWLRADAQGGCVVDWDSRELFQLRGFESIRCQNDTVAMTLRSALMQASRLPEIRQIASCDAA